MAELQWIVRHSLGAGLALVSLCFGQGCSRAKQYPLVGQVIAVDENRHELTVTHEDIRGFMPGMTMTFEVRGGGVAGHMPGDLIAATLVVEDSKGYLKDIRKTGEAPLPPTAFRPSPMIAPGDPVPDAEFTDHQGRPRRVSEWRGKTLAVTFIYTRCPLPDFCPLMDRHFSAVQRRLQEDPALAARVHLLSVSFDPDHDTPTVLRTHATGIGADPSLWSYVTGTREAIDRFAGAFGVTIMRGDQPMKEITHNLRTAVVDAGGRLVTVLNGNDWQPEQLYDALRASDGRR